MLTYFAYGSNMLPARLLARCDGVSVVGAGRLDNYAVRFDKLGRDKSGKASLTTVPGAITHGVLFEISDTQARDLDTIEGDGYCRIRCEVTSQDDRVRSAFSYTARAPQTGLIPHDWYLALILAGLCTHRLPHRHLAGQAFRPDTKTTRPARLDAIAALTNAGYSDWQLLIKDNKRLAP